MQFTLNLNMKICWNFVEIFRYTEVKNKPFTALKSSYLGLQKSRLVILNISKRSWRNMQHEIAVFKIYKYKKKDIFTANYRHTEKVKSLGDFVNS